MLAPASHATVIDSTGDVHAGDVGNAPVTRVWVVRVADAKRADELGRELAEALGMRIDVRECLPSSQKP